jgi:DnaA-homolog protein
MSQQLALGLRFPSDQRFECWIGHSAAVDACLRRVNQSVKIPLFISGATGSGKTHLLLASCAEANRLGLAVRYVPLQAMRGRLADALDDIGNVQLIAVDQFDTAISDLEQETALFHLHNRAIDSGAALVYACAQNLESLNFQLPDLRSRIAQCEHIQLSLLDDQQRRNVLQNRARARGLDIDDAVFDYVFTRVGRDLITLTVLLDRLDRASLAAQRRVTIPFLKTVLAQH